MRLLRTAVVLSAITLTGATALCAEQARPEGAKASTARGVELYQGGDRGGALAAFSQAIATQGDFAPAVYGKSAILFVDGKFKESQETLQGYLNKTVTDPFAWIWAYVSMARYSPPDRAMLTDVLALTEANTWANETIQMFLGQMTPEQYIDEVKDSTPPQGVTREEMLCRAYWLAGEAKLIAGDKDAAAKWFEQAATSAGPFQWEREMAKAEAARMKNGGQPQSQQ